MVVLKDVQSSKHCIYMICSGIMQLYCKLSYTEKEKENKKAYTIHIVRQAT